MARDIEITRITSTSFAYEIADMELESNWASTRSIARAAA